jgi:hypothetical protein
MATFILLAIGSGIFLVSFLIFLVLSLTKKRRKFIVLSLVFFVACTIFGSLAAFNGITKAYKKVSRNISENFRQRTGTEIHTAVCGNPIDTCVIVDEKMDQVVPRLDCCIWLKFSTCPEEMKRISRQFPTPSKYFLSRDSFNVSYSPRPDWWLPRELGDSIQVLQNFDI